MDGQPIGPPKRSGCVIALYVLFGVGLFFIVVGGLATWIFLQSERGQQLVTMMKEGAEWITEAVQAPGTEELRAVGCEVAMVSTASSAFELFSAFVPEEDKRAELRAELEANTGGSDLDEMQLVICTVPGYQMETPGCDDLARTYATAVDTGSDAFYVFLMQDGGEEPICQGVFSSDGRLIAEPDLDAL